MLALVYTLVLTVTTDMMCRELADFSDLPSRHYPLKDTFLPVYTAPFQLFVNLCSCESILTEWL